MTRDNYTPIACHLYDYIEAACVHHYEIEIVLRDNSSCLGVAEDVSTKDKQEFLTVQTPGGVRSIRLDSIARMQVTTRPSVFDLVDFEIL